jgi:hypothetical protein
MTSGVKSLDFWSRYLKVFHSDENFNKIEYTPIDDQNVKNIFDEYYKLLREKKYDEAIVVFVSNMTEYYYPKTPSEIFDNLILRFNKKYESLLSLLDCDLDVVSNELNLFLQFRNDPNPNNILREIGKKIPSAVTYYCMYLVLCELWCDKYTLLDKNGDVIAISYLCWIEDNEKFKWGVGVYGYDSDYYDNYYDLSELSFLEGDRLDKLNQLTEK